MKQFRKLIFWCHLTAGTLAGIVIFIMSVTGVLLAFEKQITRWADMRSYTVQQPSGQAARLSIEALLQKAREAQPQTPTGITLYGDSTRPAMLSYGGGRNLFINPYTGEAFGEGSPGVRSFFRTTTDLHRWLGAQGDNRAVARAITGASNLLFLFIVTSGFYLWWPSKRTRAQFRNVLWFRRGLSTKARDFNWHNVIGFWSVAPLFIVVLSAVVISYTWASNLVYRVVGEAPPAPTQRAPAPASQQGNSAPPPSLAGLDPLWSRAEQQVEGWKSISMQLPNSQDAPVTFTIDSGTGGQPHKRAQLVLKRQTGEVVRWEPFSSYSTGRRLRSWLRFAHTGEVGGIIGQTIAALASLGGAFLVFTGLSLAWRRFRSWLGRRNARGSLPEALPEQGD
ncbi:MAG TPA: PepSY-associated TM helix domain-containing protein [Pyrinomonadaceae bacterium]|nr:PepSY-associated TM helix domain-containing protein [Pyrinomonadaceae bacterium]